MAIEKHGFNPKPQKRNPKGKYNDKKWVKIGARDLVDIDEYNVRIYNNMDITPMYDKMDALYSAVKRKKGSGRPSKRPKTDE